MKNLASEGNTRKNEEEYKKCRKIKGTSKEKDVN